MNTTDSARALRALGVAAVLLTAYVYLVPQMLAQAPAAAPAGTQVPTVQVSGTPAQATTESTKAVVTTTVPSPASPTHVPEQVMWALAMSYALEWLKKQTWFPLLNPNTTSNMQALAGFIVAACTAAGIHVAVTGSVLDGAGLSFSITGLTMDAIKDVGFQWISQQAWYDGLVKSRALGA
jgi:hypothetical protein